MKRMGAHCIDCGSDAVSVIVDEVKPMFSMTLVAFACGAVLKSVFSANGNTGRISHSGCGDGATIREPWEEDGGRFRQR